MSRKVPPDGPGAGTPRGFNHAKGPWYARAVVTVAGIIIGDEVLAGEVVDLNGRALVELMSSCGATVRRISVIPDDPKLIGEEVRRCAEGHDHVITAGGIGPTHDDRTIAAIAAAFQCRVVRNPELEQSVRSAVGKRLNDATLKMAEVPEGAETLPCAGFPTVRFRNIYILPGVPTIFRQKLKALLPLFADQPLHRRRVLLSCHESEVADSLADLEASHPTVHVGSYPQAAPQGSPEVAVMLRSRDPDALKAAAKSMRQSIPHDVFICPVEDH